MKHRAGLDRSQTLLFPERLEDYIAAENPVRFLDAFVASLDLHTLGFAKARCADTGYYNAAEVSRCVERGLTPYIPKADTSANTARGLYGKSQFKYDAAKDVYVCPAGAELPYRFATHELGRELRYYRARGCNQCALKRRCTRNKANRTITREANEHLMEAMAAQMRAQPHKFKLRKTLAEHPFGTIKRWFGYTHFLLKGMAKVQCEWSLTTLAAYKFYAAGLQSQTRAEPGELREIDGGGGLKVRGQRRRSKKAVGLDL